MQDNFKPLISFELIEKLKDYNENPKRREYYAKPNIIDKFLAKTFLLFFPKFVKPNYITIFRFITIPIIIYLLLNNNYLYATPLFIISALSDAVDGSLARTRNHITEWGIIFDPLADKLLISSVAIITISQFLGTKVVFAIVAIEFALIISSYLRYRGKVVPAKAVGKIKMILQCVGVAAILLFALTSNPIFLEIGTYTIYLAILFGIMSLFIYKSI